MVVDFKEQSLEFLKKIFFDMLTNIPYFISLIKVRCKNKKKKLCPLISITAYDLLFKGSYV